MAIDSPYLVLPYSKSNLVTLLAEASANKNPIQIEQKQHAAYLDEYLSVLNVQTIILESRYVDHDYLEDYAGYYVRCFNRYRRTTSRIHFFSESFDKDQFQALLLKQIPLEQEQNILQSYLGFVVIKPLPQTVIGRSCLKTYPNDNNRRQFPILHTYKVNLFGIPLAVESLAYQEQDKVVAACATSALWSVFQGSGKVFHHPIPSPVEITKSASLHIPHDSASLPHDTRSLHHSGLTATQMAHAIRYVGMEPYLIGAADEYVVKSTIYAYLKGKIPALLGISLSAEANGTATPMGRHAVAVTGYSLSTNTPTPFSNSSILITASKIDKIYVHDDQIGPFAKMEFTGNSHKLLTSWPDSNKVKGNVYATPQMLLIPLYHKIRIPFEIIHDKLAEFDVILETLRVKSFLSCLTSRLVWDIYLSEVNDFKKELHHNTTLNNVNKEKILLLNMPKYLWRAAGYDNDGIKLDVLFDATDIEQGAIIITILFYDPMLEKLLTAIAPIMATHNFGEGARFFEKIIQPPIFKPVN